MRMTSDRLRSVLFLAAGFAWAASAAEPGPALRRPIHWWIGNAHARASCATASQVASWTVAYIGPYRKDFEDRRWARQVGGENDIVAAIQAIREQVGQGARLLATNHENWSVRTTATRATDFVRAIEDSPDLQVIQWNHHKTWEPDALPILTGLRRLQLVEMIYPTCEGKRTAEEIRGWILACLEPYGEESRPAIGLSVYEAHDNKTPVGW
ncbi:MAG: hypothetical protein U1E27_09190, partial [Kiritimatiellia bacterium]|nr:hypothetical protein [Kiritimatiellia bacterium]